MMKRAIEDDPLVRSLLRHSAASRYDDDAMSSLARRVLSGETTLRAAASDRYHGEGLASTFEAALRERAGLTAEQRAEYERQAEQLRDAGNRNRPRAAE
jgi:hypothetical protein